MKRSHVLKKLNDALDLLIAVKAEFLQQHEWTRTECYSANSLDYEISCIADLINRIDTRTVSRHELLRTE
jgi:hypothetical protein